MDQLPLWPKAGDPISPYLFILVADVLQILIKQSTQIRHPIVDNVTFSVLQYADDTLLLVRGELFDVQALKTLLDRVCQRNRFANQLYKKHCSADPYG